MLFINVFNIVLGMVLSIFVFGGNILPIYGQTTTEQTTSKQTSPKSITSPVLTVFEHPWGRFAPQSWVCLQKTTWTNREKHPTTDIREIKTTLQTIDANGVTLQEVQTTGAGEKRTENAPIIRRFDFFQQPIQEGMKIRNAAPTKLIIDHQIIPCEVRIYEQTTPAGKRKTTIWYSTQLYPYVLRSENVLRSIPTDKDPQERILEMTITEVLESSAFHLRKSKRGTYRLRTTQKSGNVTTISEMSCSRHVPGGILRKTIREFERKGNEIREIRTVDIRLINVYYGGSPSNNRKTYSATIPETSTFYSESVSPRRRYYYMPYPSYRNIPVKPNDVVPPDK
jgi:hypothetical protein